MRDFIPQTSSLGTRFQTPSSLRADCSLLSEKDMKSMRDFPSRLRLNITNHTSQLSQSDSVVRVKGTGFPCGVWGKAPIVLPIVPRCSRNPFKPHLRIMSHTSPKKQLSQSDSVVRVKGMSSLVGFGAKPQSFLPIVPRCSRIPSKPHLRITNYTSPKKTAVAKRQRSQGQGNKVPLWGLGQSPNRPPNRP